MQCFPGPVYPKGRPDRGTSTAHLGVLISPCSPGTAERPNLEEVPFHLLQQLPCVGQRMEPIQRVETGEAHYVPIEQTSSKALRSEMQRRC